MSVVLIIKRLLLQRADIVILSLSFNKHLLTVSSVTVMQQASCPDAQPVHEFVYSVYATILHACSYSYLCTQLPCNFEDPVYSTQKLYHYNYVTCMNIVLPMHVLNHIISPGKFSGLATQDQSGNRQQYFSELTDFIRYVCEKDFGIADKVHFVHIIGRGSRYLCSYLTQVVSTIMHVKSLAAIKQP